VLTLTEKINIIDLYFNKKMTQKEIAKLIGKSVKTVRKYIKSYSENLNKLDKNISEEELEAVINSIAEKPKYDVSNRKKRKLNDEIITEIEKCLELNEEHLRKGRYKQLMKGIDIHEHIESKGFVISYTTICNYLRGRETAKEAFIKQEYNLGQTLEFDWGTVKLEIAEKPVTLELALFTTACGSYHFPQLYRNQKMENFLDAHVKAFKEFKGVHREVVYDNMKQAVKKFVGFNEKEATDDLKKISLYYGFNYRFCNIASGNEKGHVERGVEFIRRRVFSFRSSFKSLEDAKEYMRIRVNELNSRSRGWLNGNSPSDILSKEQKHLLSLRPDYDTARRVECRVGKYSTVIIDQNNYSVPDHLVGKFVIIKVTTDTVKIYYKNNLIAKHNRSYELNDWKIEIYHYTETLKKKPGALENSVAKSQMEPKLQHIYNTYYTHTPKEFIYLLEVIKENSFEEILNIIKKLDKIRPSLVTTENIKASLNIPIETHYIPKHDEEITNASIRLVNNISQLFQLN
jgi:transposase/predicted transcriptional regulator